MPYLGRTPAGAAGNVITGDLKVTGVLSADSISNNIVLDSTDGSANENDNVVMDGTDSDSTNADDNLLCEENTGDMLVEKRIPTSFGTDGQVLTSTGETQAAFEALATGGSWEFVTRTVASSSATIEFTGLEAGYDYKIEMNDVHGSADSQYMHVNYGTGASPTYQTSGYSHLSTSAFSNSSIYMNASGEIGTGDTMFCGSGNRPLDNASDNSYNFEWLLFNPGNADINTLSMWRGYAPTNEGPTACFHWGGGYREADEAVTAIKWSLNTGNFSDGNFMLFKRSNGIT